MILTLLNVVLPVFLVMAAGYAATKAGGFPSSAVDGLMKFSQHFAIPCLLFHAVRTLDVDAEFDWGLITSFYLGAFIVFVMGIWLSQALYNRRPGEAVAIGFAALFSNTVLLGLPITERAYGAEALGPSYAIVALNAPFCYGVGIAVMEYLRADGRGFLKTTRLVTVAILKNPLMIAIMLGALANALALAPPEPMQAAIDMMIAGALPAAVFGLGGILARYRLNANLGPLGMLVVLALVIHPAITWVLATQVFALPDGMVRSAVVLASMAPGVNAYIFASMYRRSEEVVSASVLACTVVSVGTVSFWLWLLP